MPAAEDETYTHGHHDSVLRSHRWRTVENSAAYVADRLVPGALVLDVGCGPGTITVDMARHVAPAELVGLDPSAEVIEAATRDAAEAGVANVAFRVGDVYALDLPDDAFDVVHAHQVLQHIGDPVAALREMRRVCKPGGVVAARDVIYRSFTWFPVDQELARYLEVYCAVHEANGGEPDAGSRMRTWAQAAGFTEIECRASAWCYATSAEVQWWGDLWADRLTKTALGDRAVELALATRDEVEALAAAWRRWATHDDAWFACTHGELLAHG
jgi:SAM-dependent methyltransferase